MLVNLITRYLTKAEIENLFSTKENFDSYNNGKVYPIEVYITTNLRDGRSYSTKPVIVWHPIDQHLGSNNQFYILGDKFYRETLSVLFDTAELHWFGSEATEFFEKLYNIFQFYKNGEVLNVKNS